LPCQPWISPDKKNKGATKKWCRLVQTIYKKLHEATPTYLIPEQNQKKVMRVWFSLCPGKFKAGFLVKLAINILSVVADGERVFIFAVATDNHIVFLHISAFF